MKLPEPSIKSMIVFFLSYHYFLFDTFFFNCLKNKTISGAAIDTWWIYPDRPKPGFKSEKKPRPSDFPFHALENVIMTPHNSAHTMDSDTRRSNSILKNLKEFKKGKKPPGFVFYGKN